MERISIIGAGNMGSALVRGLISAGKATTQTIRAYDTDPAKCLFCEKEMGIRIASTLEETVQPETTVLILSVKPQIIAGVLERLAGLIHDRLLVVSIAAGIPTSFILSRFSSPARVIRVMPNAAAMVGCSATALCRAGLADSDDMKRVLDLFSAVGTAVEVDEKMMNLVTGLASSGLGYLFAMMEAFTDAGVKLGLDRPTARQLTVQTFAGAAMMASDQSSPFSELKDRITSPGGTTIAGLHVLERSGLRGILMDIVEVATRRAEELAPKD